MNALGSPIKAGGGADEIRPLLQGGATSKLDVFQFLDGSEMLVDQRGVGERPEVLSGLQLWRIGRRKE